MFGGSIVRNTIKVGRIQIPPTVVYLASVVYSMLLMINLLGCALFIIAEIQHSKLENTWVFKYISGTHDVPDGNDPIVYIVDVIDSYSQFELYVISIYWAVTTARRYFFMRRNAFLGNDGGLWRYYARIDS